MKRTLSIFAHIMIVALVLIATGPVTSQASTDEVITGPESLDGHWRLDWDRSDSFEPVMKALEVPWLMRKLAGVARVSLELQTVSTEVNCDECEKHVRIVLSTPVSSDEIRVELDDIARPGKDPRGRDTLDAYRWSTENGLEMDRAVKLPSGAQARLLESRKIGFDPSILISNLTVWIDGQERARVLRTFTRVNE